MAFPADYTLLGDLETPTVTGSHTDFVAVLTYNDFTASMLASIDNGGGDLRISSDAAGSSQLPLDVVEFDKVGNSIQVWVKVPSLSTGSKIYIWGNNTGDTKEGDTSAYGRNAVYSDSEARWSNVDGTDITGGGVNLSAVGAATFNDTRGGYTCLSASETQGFESLGNTDTFTTSDTVHQYFWFYRDTNVSHTTADFSELLLSIATTGSGDGFSTYLNDNSDIFVATNGGNTLANAHSSTRGVGSWLKVDAIFDQTNNQVKMYVNGDLKVTTSSYTDNSVGGAEITMLVRVDGQSGVDGAIRDAGYEIAAPSDSRISTEYANQSANGWFIPSDAGGGATYTLNLDTGSITNTGSVANLTQSIKTLINSGVITAAGSNLDFSSSKGFLLESETVSVTGSILTLKQSIKTVIDSGNILLTGSALNFVHTPGASGFTFNLDSGAITTSGNGATLTQSLTTPLDSGSHTVNGQVINIGQLYNFAFDTGSINNNLGNLLAPAQYVMMASSGSVTLTGRAMNLTASSDVIQTIDSFSVTYASDIVSINYAQDSFTVSYKG